MKLYLSSYNLGDKPARLAALPAKNKKVAVIRNALDIYTDPVRLKQGLEAECVELKAIGLHPEALDLRLFFGNAEKLEAYLREFGFIWVTGGNSFVLRRAFAQSGLDIILKKKLCEDDFVYAGYSAGACIVAMSLSSGARVI
jgi:dipeptidase E